MTVAHAWPEDVRRSFLLSYDGPLHACVTWGIGVGAGEGNRTLMTSLEGWGSAIELRPRGKRAPRCSVPVPRAGALGQCREDARPRPRLLTRSRWLRVLRALFGARLGKINFGASGMWRSLVSAPALGAGGRGFESRHPD